MRVTKRLRSERGFTLLEVLIATFLLVVAFLGVASILWTSAKSRNYSRWGTAAASMGQKLMEQVKLSDYATVNAGYVFSGYSTSTDNMRFNRVITVLDNTPAADMKTVTVRVSWDNGRHMRQYMTIIHKDY